MYFYGEFSTDSNLGAGSYAAGARQFSPFQIGVLTEALAEAYRTTGDTTIRDRLVRMADFLDTYGLDSTYQYSCSTMGIVGGQPYCSYNAGQEVKFWDPVYTIALVDSFVYAYKYTGNIAYYNRALYFWNRGTKGIYGSPTSRCSTDTVVCHFADTLFDSAVSYLYLQFNKGELQYGYRLFENGGFPTIVAFQAPPAAPAITRIARRRTL
jgi:hypothetical protein